MTSPSLSPSAPLVAAIRAIEDTRRRIAVVTAADGRLLGTLTDGDVRRCLLAGGTIETPVSEAMNCDPIVAEEGASNDYLIELMRRGNILAVPLVDHDRRFRKLVHVTDLTPGDLATGGGEGFAFAVIMAGGEGMRLRPVTERIPKPMLDIGGMPLLERQIQRMARAGIPRIYLAINYLGHMIEEHFGDGAQFGVDLQYLKESEKLGTGGALSLLPEKPPRPIVVVNGDILTTLDFAGLHSFHQAHNAYVTVAVVDYRVSVPYGVIVAEGARITGLKEKPAQRFLCNAGVYAISPNALVLTARHGPYNMTDVVNSCLEAGHTVAAFPVHEYWSDVGTPDDLDRARAIFAGTMQ